MVSYCSCKKYSFCKFKCRNGKDLMEDATSTKESILRWALVKYKWRMSEQLQGVRPFGWAGQCGVNFNMPKHCMNGGRDKKGGNIELKKEMNTIFYTILQKNRKCNNFNHSIRERSMRNITLITSKRAPNSLEPHKRS